MNCIMFYGIFKKKTLWFFRKRDHKNKKGLLFSRLMSFEFDCQLFKYVYVMFVYLLRDVSLVRG